jgi:hypothetical protein
MPWQMGSHALREAEQQCLVRDANEAAELLNVALVVETKWRELHCECGDGACRARVSMTHAEYEAVRDYGSRFVIRLDHENPENACVLTENARFGAIDVVARDARHQALTRNPRHAWVDSTADAIGQPSLEPKRSN